MFFSQLLAPRAPRKRPASRRVELEVLEGRALLSTSGAHFQEIPTSSVADNGALVVSFDEAGLGNENVNYTLSAHAVANYGCINGGGNHPQASNKETVVAEVSNGATFQPKNGRVQASLNAGPPPVTAGFSCPSGQTLVLADVTYSTITLTDTTNHVTTGVTPDPVSRTFFTFKK